MTPSGDRRRSDPLRLHFSPISHASYHRPLWIHCSNYLQSGVQVLVLLPHSVLPSIRDGSRTSFCSGSGNRASRRRSVSPGTRGGISDQEYEHSDVELATTNQQRTLDVTLNYPTASTCSAASLVHHVKDFLGAFGSVQGKRRGVE